MVQYAPEPIKSNVPFADILVPVDVRIVRSLRVICVNHLDVFDSEQYVDVRVALDWTPNTDHTGFYVASAKGWYADAGIHVQLLPYNQTAPETLVAAGQAECGVSFQDSLTFAVAAGAQGGR